MTARSIRRAAERKAKKLARKAEHPATIESSGAEVTAGLNQESAQAAAAPPVGSSVDECPEVSDQASPDYRVAREESHERRSAANRANAQLSTGPRTPAGRAKSSLNAVKTGLTGQTVLLPTDDVAEYEQHMLAYRGQFAPVGQREIDLVQSIAETAWRLKRIPSLEYAVYAVGHMELAENFEDHDPEVRPQVIQLAVHLKYEKQIRNLQLQEARLVRRREKELAELRQLQQERKAAEQNVVESTIQRTPLVRPPENGFEFSTAELLAYRERVASLPSPLGHAKAA